jgi:hypothetical protein
MKPLFLGIVIFSMLLIGASCKEVQKRPIPGGANTIIHDIPCAEVKNKILQNIGRNQIPFVREDPDQQIFLLGPVQTAPMSNDAFLKMEETGRLEIKCVDPISTRISVQLQLKGLASDNRWLEIKDPDKLYAYGTRFLDRIIPKP